MFWFSFSDTKFCESILLPTEKTLKKSLETTFVIAKQGMHLDEKNNADLCCRTLHKCDAHKRIEFNQTNDEWYIRHCECVNSFKMCLNTLETSLSKEFAFSFSINATKCFSLDYPIVRCIKFQTYSESKSQFFQFPSSLEREKYFNRCQKYELDYRKPKQLQMFDLPFNDIAMFAIPGKCHQYMCHIFVLIFFFFMFLFLNC